MYYGYSVVHYVVDNFIQKYNSQNLYNNQLNNLLLDNNKRAVAFRGNLKASSFNKIEKTFISEHGEKK